MLLGRLPVAHCSERAQHWRYERLNTLRKNERCGAASCNKHTSLWIRPNLTIAATTCVSVWGLIERTVKKPMTGSLQPSYFMQPITSGKRTERDSLFRVCANPATSTSKSRALRASSSLLHRCSRVAAASIILSAGKGSFPVDLIASCSRVTACRHESSPLEASAARSPSIALNMFYNGLI